jgi:uridine kinase
MSASPKGERREIKRAMLIENLASHITSVKKPHPVRVAIDGVDGAGKTTLADELAEPARRQGRPVIRASIDGFHNPQNVRYRLGRQSPEGYFRDSFNHDALIESLLLPLGPGGSRSYRRHVFDYRTDTEDVAPLETTANNAILLFDGVFAHRPELSSYWDFSIFLDTRFEVSIPRTAQRGGGSPEVDVESNRRYVEGQRLYLAECEPKSLANLVVDNNDLENPSLASD